MLDILIFFTYLFYGYLCCTIMDKTSIYLYNKFSINNDYSQNVRWFFIHFIINVYITIIGYPNIIFSLKNIGSCGIANWINGYEIYGMAMALHIYHIINFKLTPIDWLHHIMTAILTGPVVLTTDATCASAVGLWFASGLPGAIDYFLLWLVKMGYLNKKYEKFCYVLISCWIRAPGCIYTATLQLGVIPYLNQYSYIDILGKFWTTMIVYWNGIFFLHLTLKDYYSKVKL